MKISQRKILNLKNLSLIS